jgi:hypothetical protein
MTKKVTFAEDAKKHDGVRLHNKAVAYYQIMCGAFNMKNFLDYKVSRKVRTYKDVLYITNFDQEVLVYCKEKLATLISLVDERGEIEKEPVEDVAKVNSESSDWDHWESPELDKKASNVKKLKVSVVRRGSRDFGMCVEFQHLKYLAYIYSLIKEAIEQNEVADFLGEWVTVEKN